MPTRYMKEPKPRKPYRTLSLSKDGNGAKSKDSADAENAALRQEIDHLREQRDFLKMTLGIFCDPTKSSTKVF